MDPEQIEGKHPFLTVSELVESLGESVLACRQPVSKWDGPDPFELQLLKTAF